MKRAHRGPASIVNSRWLVLAGFLLLSCASSWVAAAPFAFNYGSKDEQTTILATALDNSGNTYICGTFGSATLTMGSMALTRLGFVDSFAAKLDTAGTVLWAKGFGGTTAQTRCRAAMPDNAGNVYLGGDFGQGNLTSPPLSVIGVFDAFVFKLDAATGNTVWAKNFGGIGNAVSYGRALASDGSGNVYLGGDFSSGGNLTTPPLTRIGAYDAFVFKLNAGTGAIAWAKNFGGKGAATYGRALTAAAGSIYLGGDFATANLTTPALTRIGFRDGYAFKLDAATGSLAWAKNFGGPDSSVGGLALTTDGSGSVYLAGGFSGFVLTTPRLDYMGGSGDAFVFKLSAGTGTITWAKTFGGSGAEAAAVALASDGLANIYLGGFFARADITTPPLTRIGPWTTFAFKLDTATGNTMWTKSFGGPGADTFLVALAADAPGNVYLGGYFQNATLTIPPLTKIGNVDAFIISYPTVAPAPGTLVVTKSGSGTGVVNSSPAGIDCNADCSEAYAASAVVTLTAMASAGSVFSGWLGPCAGNGICNVTINGDRSVIAVFAPSGTSFKYDPDVNRKSDALTDGLIILRHLFGLTGSSVTSGALAPDATLTDPTAIRQLLTDIAPMLDVDGNGQIDALTDGLMIIRYMFGLRGASLTAGAVGSGATRTGAEIEALLQSRMAP